MVYTGEYLLVRNRAPQKKYDGLTRERKKSFNLEKDLPLSKDDFGSIGTPQPREPEVLGSYLDFLDELWESGEKETKKKFYPDQFCL